MAASDAEPDLKEARDQLNLVLSFFSRVDAKFSTILAIDTGMLAAVGASFPSADQFKWWLAIAPAITVVLLCLSYFHLYRGGFPNVDGGHDSFIYFRSIAKRTEAKFIQGYLSQSHDELKHDVLGQVWRNSEILAFKFDRLKSAFIFMAWAVLPWVLSLVLFAAFKAKVHITVNQP
jgi:hypothetical protein